MWFVMLGVALALLVASGLYLRRRIGDALRNLGVGPGPTRWVRRTLAWLWFGYPALMVVTVLIALGSGQDTMPAYDGPLATWLLVYPFYIAALVLLHLWEIV